MNAAPDYLDEAKVIKWAWSDSPFGANGMEKIAESLSDFFEKARVINNQA